MKISDKGITVDCDLMRSAFRPMDRLLNFQTVFAAITVNDERPEAQLDDVVINVEASSAFAWAIYSPSQLRLVVRFVSEGTYAYEGITLQTAFDFAAADSKGRFFRDKIRNKHVARKV